MAKKKAAKKRPGNPHRPGSKKTGPKPIVPRDTPQRRKQIQEHKEKMKANPKPPHPFARHAGKPRLFNSPEEMIAEINNYFDWIEGEKEIRKVKVPANNHKGYVEVEEEVWIRKPEPPTITGMCLYIGVFGGISSFEAYRKKYPEYSDVVNYGISRVTYGYEGNLHGAKCFGSTFALVNIQKQNWKNRQEVFNDLSDNVIDAFNYIVPASPSDNTPTDPRNDDNDIQK